MTSDTGRSSSTDEAGASTEPRATTRPDTTRLSVVIPTLDEAERLPLLLGDISSYLDDGEIVVVDGGSTDGTPALAGDAGAEVIRTAPDRGSQLRAGADASSGRWLFFVHADCRLRPEAAGALRRFVATADEEEFAHFGFELDGDEAIHRFIELGQRLRERWLGLIYGDQGLVVSRSLYRRVSGYPDWPLMEDVGMIRRLEALGRRVTLPTTLVTSSRRYDEEGGLRRWLRNVTLMILFQAGVDPERLSRWYAPRRRPRPEGPRARLVGVFAKAPTAGRVKTRLAADVGDARATAIYRMLGRATVDVLRGGPYRLVVFVDPPDPGAFEAVGRWLGADGIELRPQRAGDLGARMFAALEEALDEVDRALLVGADIPGIDEETVERAFAALLDHDVVVGPATDGGYYLIGLSRPLPRLFEEIPWSTDRVLPLTLARAEEDGLSVALLEAKSDVDTAEDLPPALLAEAAVEAR